MSADGGRGCSLCGTSTERQFPYGFGPRGVTTLCVGCHLTLSVADVDRLAKAGVRARPDLWPDATGPVESDEW